MQKREMFIHLRRYVEPCLHSHLERLQHLDAVAAACMEEAKISRRSQREVTNDQISGLDVYVEDYLFLHLEAQ